MSQRRTFLRTALLWAMLPLTAIGSAPRVLCLCANGDLKLFCCAAKAEPTCCPAQTNTQSARSCCHRTAKPAHSHSACVTGNRCTPVIAVSDGVPKVEPVGAPVVAQSVERSFNDVVAALLTDGSWTNCLEGSPPFSERAAFLVSSRLVI
jgi:hypothetical protein